MGTSHEKVLTCSVHISLILSISSSLSLVGYFQLTAGTLLETFV